MNRLLYLILLCGIKTLEKALASSVVESWGFFCRSADYWDGAEGQGNSICPLIPKMPFIIFQSVFL